MPTSYLALLRGVNVGGKNKLPMADLAAIFATAGCTDVRTFIQSGNVVFNAAPDLHPQLSTLIADEITALFGFRTPVILRSVEQLQSVLSTNPYFVDGAVEDQLHVYFLADTPDPERVSRLDPDRSPPDEYAVIGQEIYARLPNGMGNTKLTNAYFDSKLATISTARNWRTVTKLLELMLS